MKFTNAIIIVVSALFCQSLTTVHGRIGGDKLNQIDHGNDSDDTPSDVILQEQEESYVANHPSERSLLGAGAVLSIFATSVLKSIGTAVGTAAFNSLLWNKNIADLSEASMKKIQTIVKTQFDEFWQGVQQNEAEKIFRNELHYARSSDVKIARREAKDAHDAIEDVLAQLKDYNITSVITVQALMALGTFFEQEQLELYALDNETPQFIADKKVGVRARVQGNIDHLYDVRMQLFKHVRSELIPFRTYQDGVTCALWSQRKYFEVNGRNGKTFITSGCDASGCGPSNCDWTPRHIDGGEAEKKSQRLPRGVG